MTTQTGGGGGGSPLSLLQQEYGLIFPASVLNNLTGTSINGYSTNATEGLLCLDEFMAGFWYTWHNPSFFRHLFAGSAFLGTYFILGSLVFARRLYLRQCVLFKVVHRAHGRYIIPSVFDTFTISLLIFALTNISFVILAYRAYYLRDHNAQHAIRLFEILQWIPLFTAGWMACTGSFLTGGALDGPPQLRTRRASHSISKRKEFMQKLATRLRLPTIVNCITLGVPFIMAAAIVPCAILSQRAHMHGYNLYRHFHSDIIQPLVEQAPLNLGQDIPAMVLLQAAQVREAAIRDARFMSAAFYVWTGGAAVVLAMYLPCGGILLWLIWKQVRRQKEVVISGIGTYKGQGTTLRKNITGAPPTLHRWCVNCGRKMMAARHVPCECGFSVGIASAADVNSRWMDEGDYERHRNQDIVDEDNVDLARMAAAFKGRVVKQQGTPLLRYFYLRRCRINFTLIYLSITCTTFTVLVAAGIFGAHLVPSMSLGPAHYTRLYLIACLLSNWSLLVFGSLATAAIWLRHFDPANDPEYYERAGETGYAPSTGLSLLGLGRAPRPIQRLFSGFRNDQGSADGGLEKSPSTAALTVPYRFTSSSLSLNRLQKSGKKLKRLSGLRIGTPSKFKHVMQEPPQAGDEDEDGDEEKGREVHFQMISPDGSPLPGGMDSTTSVVAAPTAAETAPPVSPQSVVPWSLRRSPSALSMGTAGGNQKDDSVSPTPSGTLNPPRTPVRYATPFGPIEGTPSYSEPFSDSNSTDASSSHRSPSNPSPAQIADLQLQQGRSSGSQPGWNDRFTALRRSAIMTSRPGTSESAIPRLSSSSSQPHLRAQAHQQFSDLRQQPNWSPHHWRTPSFSSGVNQGQQ
ncbi:hypothetical protein A4X13_0g137 [Tilletia indica]|uniref:Uncharacterized protein n=1 Tax=Tilletia indica TaxID=43049 RepID=A0A177TL26_9BASI|nr:hypothetical protein A4X13_0g137 [Tilletia indica]